MPKQGFTTSIPVTINSQWGRFLNADDIQYLGANGDLEGFNLHIYCSNNPVNCIDPTGHSMQVNGRALLVHLSTFLRKSAERLSVFPRFLALLSPMTADSFFLACCKESACHAKGKKQGMKPDGQRVRELIARVGEDERE
ncbi:MAG: hypothetical protein E7663_00135 [Ruminococcaceae bacterium]|nr:hypothetical protein [Oscillospiraceae bacterium]